MQELNARELLKWEKELLGLYLSGRPVDRHRHLLEKQNLQKISELKSPSLSKPETVRVAGEVTALRKLTTRNGDMMAVLTLEDWHDSAGIIEVVLFPRTSMPRRWTASPIVNAGAAPADPQPGRRRDRADPRPLRRKPRRSPDYSREAQPRF